MTKEEFTVIIVGASIAGLTLAHCLQRANIKHIVLEKSGDPAPQLGASIGILPNGARIIDQLGLLDEILGHTEPLGTANIHFPDGYLWTSTYPTLITERFGFPIAFLDRQKVLEILFQSYPEPDRIRLSDRVATTENTGNGVTVTTENGKAYYGHLVVGADGTHSQIRSEIWRAAERDSPGLIRAREKDSMIAEYRCIFGTSSPIQGLTAGEQVNACFDGLVIITIHGKGGRLYWFVVQKLEEPCAYTTRPRFTAADTARAAESLRDYCFYKEFTFGQVWDGVETSSMTMLEEHLLDTWHYGRMVLVGDSAHKMTPNFGQGANMAIEDAAVLTNILKDLLDQTSLSRLPTNEQIGACLRRYRDTRYKRLASIDRTSRYVTRLQSRKGLLNHLIGRYVAPYGRDLPADLASKTIGNAPVLEFLPIPRRCGEGWKRYSGGNTEHWKYFIQVVGVLFVLVLLRRWVALLGF